MHISVLPMAYVKGEVATRSHSIVGSANFHKDHFVPVNFYMPPDSQWLNSGELLPIYFFFLSMANFNVALLFKDKYICLK